MTLKLKFSAALRESNAAAFLNLIALNILQIKVQTLSMLCIIAQPHYPTTINFYETKPYHADGPAGYCMRKPV
jgi:hypothetical protein